jgi:hypothetical protein
LLGNLSSKDAIGRIASDLAVKIQALQGDEAREIQAIARAPPAAAQGCITLTRLSVNAAFAIPAITGAKYYHVFLSFDKKNGIRISYQIITTIFLSYILSPCMMLSRIANRVSGCLAKQHPIR